MASSSSNNVRRLVRDRDAQDRWKDWSFLDGCFKDTSISPSDVDGIVERNGKFLLLEGKLPAGTVSDGQMRMYRNLSRALSAPLLIMWGYPGDVREVEAWYKGQLWFERKKKDSEWVRRYITKWFEWADER